MIYSYNKYPLYFEIENKLSNNKTFARFNNPAITQQQFCNNLCKEVQTKRRTRTGVDIDISQ